MRTTTLTFSLLALTFFMISCIDSTDIGEEPDPAGLSSYEAQVAFPGLQFDKPVDLQHAGDNSNRLFVVEQPGVISVFPNDSTTEEKTTFLDISDQVDDSGNEEGLLGLAFHPNYEENGYFYVNYTTPDSRTVICRFRVSADDPNKADESTETLILPYDQPYDNHNGGQLQFGPDGYLYIAVGDGGSGGDPEGNAQDRSTLLGSILRIDVDRMEDGNEYGIPTDNPYVDNENDYREEIYAYGLRNPWRFSFDAEEGTLWAGDVGQGDYEEIDIIEAGENYGWNIMEGNNCYDSNDCDQSGLVPPVVEYGHNQGQSVTGGYVYRGTNLEGLVGWYVYADFVSGRIWALNTADPANPNNTELLNTDLSIASFGVDADNELYICAFDGKIYRLAEMES